MKTMEIGADQIYYRRIYYLVTMLSFLTAGVVSVSNYFLNKNYFIATLVFGMAILILVNYLAYFVHKKIEFATFLLCFLLVLVLPISAFSFDVSKNSLAWQTTIVTVLMVLQGKKKGTFWVLTLISLFVGVVLLKLFGNTGQSSISQQNLYMTVFAMLTTWAVLHIYFRTSEVRDRLLSERTKELEEGIEKISRTENELKKINADYESNLEKMAESNKNLSDTRNAMFNLIEDLEVEKVSVEGLKDKLALATESAKIGVWDWDVEKNILSWDKTMYELYGVDPEKFSGAYDAWQAGLHPDDKEMGDIAIKKALGGEKKFDIQFRVVWPDESIHYIQAHAVVVRNSNKKPIKMVGVNWDITLEKNVDRMKTEFISLASHQLRTPLSAMKWFSEMLLNGDAGELAPEQKEFVKNISDSNERMISLVNALLNVSRIESGRLSVSPEPTDVKKMLDGIVLEVTPKLEEKKQKLVLSINQNLPLINLDPKMIREVYLNLLTNAIKYSKEGGEVILLVSKDDTHLVSQITDNGIGIPKAQQARVFQKFFRADNAVKSEADGTGLGLYLIKSIIDSSGGNIEFKSEEGEGSVFRFSLPLKGMDYKKGEVTINS